MVEIGGAWTDGLCMVVYGMTHGLIPSSQVASEAIMPDGFLDGIMDIIPYIIPVDIPDGVEAVNSQFAMTVIMKSPLHVAVLRIMVV